MLPWAEKLHKERKDNISKHDPEARCLPPRGSTHEHDALSLDHGANRQIDRHRV
jgi:hypothetical protein